MTGAQSTVQDRLLKEFENPWRDETPVFDCCRRAVAIAVEEVEPLDIVSLDATARVEALREGVSERLPDRLDNHRCCAGHIADLAFDLPSLVAPASGELTSQDTHA